MKIYTKTGDKGETGLVGGSRVPKDAVRVEAYGTVDELNALLGVVRQHPCDPFTQELLPKIQNQLFTVGCELATPHAEESLPKISEAMVQSLEQAIDFVDAQMPQLTQFILPGGSVAASYLHLARTVCRRAERRVVTLSHTEAIRPIVMVYLNRLSDLLFMLARYQNFTQRIAETTWNKTVV